MALYSTRFIEKENGCLKFISLIKPKILICYMPYFEALLYPHPLGAPPGANFSKSKFYPVGGSLVPLTRWCYFWKSISTWESTSLLEKSNIFAPTPPQGVGQTSKHLKSHPLFIPLPVIYRLLGCRAHQQANSKEGGGQLYKTCVFKIDENRKWDRHHWEDKMGQNT